MNHRMWLCTCGFHVHVHAVCQSQITPNKCDFWDTCIIIQICEYWYSVFLYSGSVDGNHQLIIKGRFQQKQIETVLRRYISKWKTSLGR